MLSIFFLKIFAAEEWSLFLQTKIVTYIFRADVLNNDPFKIDLQFGGLAYEVQLHSKYRNYVGVLLKQKNPNEMGKPLSRVLLFTVQMLKIRENSQIHSDKQIIIEHKPEKTDKVLYTRRYFYALFEALGSLYYLSNEKYWGFTEIHDHSNYFRMRFIIIYKKK